MEQKRQDRNRPVFTSPGKRHDPPVACILQESPGKPAKRSLCEYLRGIPARDRLHLFGGQVRLLELEDRRFQQELRKMRAEQKPVEREAIEQAADAADSFERRYLEADLPGADE